MDDEFENSINNLKQDERDLLDRGHWDKYPRILVTGFPITIEQAKEIIRVTDSFYTWMRGGDKEYISQIVHQMRFPILNDDITTPDMEKIVEWKKRWGILPGIHAQNHWIGKTMIDTRPGGSARGWCHIDGTIGRDFNSGKWPDAEEIYLSWRNVAERFPFLDLGISIYDDTCHKEFPEFSFKIRNGLLKIIDSLQNNVHSDHPPIEYRQKWKSKDDISQFISVGKKWLLPQSWMNDWAALAEQLFPTEEWLAY